MTEVTGVLAYATLINPVFPGIHDRLRAVIFMRIVPDGCGPI
jgi:formate hydrogenlyase subunit 4